MLRQEALHLHIRERPLNVSPERLTSPQHLERRPRPLLHRAALLGLPPLARGMGARAMLMTFCRLSVHLIWQWSVHLERLPILIVFIIWELRRSSTWQLILAREPEPFVEHVLATKLHREKAPTFPLTAAGTLFAVGRRAPAGGSCGGRDVLDAGCLPASVAGAAATGDPMTLTTGEPLVPQALFSRRSEDRLGDEEEGDQGLHLFGTPCGEAPEADLAPHIPQKHLLQRLTTEWRVPSKKDVHEDPNAEAIDLTTISLASQNLWCDVARGAAPRQHGRVVPLRGGEAEIYEFDLITQPGFANILRLDVTVHDAAVVEEVQC
mmetsp:Transcript_105438/g.263960  ORF Transcript_105438/g.263960 Transcript_105438/m.263960 type:complete len:322 (+) Transcript_105438:593-1558(+)